MSLPQILLAILPSGTVINETIFFSYIFILMGLLVIAIWLRRKRTRKTSTESPE
ncbi:MAG: hypothetical protein ACXWFC_03975 [Nitrososphaeraceae archaeon]